MILIAIAIWLATILSAFMSGFYRGKSSAMREAAEMLKRGLFK